MAASATRRVGSRISCSVLAPRRPPSASPVWALTPVTRFVYGVAPIATDQAVLLTRPNEDAATHFWAQLVRTNGTVVWSTELSPLQVHEALGFSGIAATDDRVVVMADVDNASVVIALDRATGERLWQTPIPRGADTGLIGTVLICPPARARTAMGRVAPPSLFDRRLALWQLRRPDEADRGDHRQARRQDDAPRTSIFPATHPSRGRPAGQPSSREMHAIGVPTL